VGRAQQISRSQSIRAFGRVPSSNCSRAPIAETQSPCGEQMNGKMGEFNGSSNSVCTCQDECEAGGALVFFTPCCFPHVVLPTLQRPIRSDSCVDVLWGRVLAPRVIMNPPCSVYRMPMPSAMYEPYLALRMVSHVQSPRSNNWWTVRFLFHARRRKLA